MVISAKNFYSLLLSKVNFFADVKDIAKAISKSEVGLCIVCENKQFKGIITDGDLRRGLEKGEDLSKIKAKSIYNESPVIIKRYKLI